MRRSASNGNRNAASQTVMSNPVILSAQAHDVIQAAQLLRQGALVAFPTETVYGLGADARNGTAIARIYEAKGRPSFNPLIVHVASTDQATGLALWSDTAELLAAHFWPGPLSLVLPLAPDHGLSSLVTAGLPSVAIRVPAHPAAQALLAAFDGPVAAPSANSSGRISPTNAQHVIDGLGARIDAVLDDGSCHVGLESTIVGLTSEPVLLRAGGVAREEIEAVLGARLKDPATGEISAPGQLTSHYAPQASVRLNATTRQEGEVLLGFGEMPCDLNLSPTGDLTEAAAHLFEYLHRLDATGQRIAVASVPHTGLGAAINDRLERAAAPR